MKSSNYCQITIMLVILIILLLVIALYYYNKYETFQNSNDKCQYLPWGPSVDACTNNCMSEDRKGLWDESGKDCSYDRCSEKCSMCDSVERCEWINSWNSKEIERLRSAKTDTFKFMKTLVPRKLQLSGISYPDTQNADKAVVKIFWNNNEDATEYMVHYYNMGKFEDKIKLDRITDNTLSEYELNNLETSGEYSIIMYAINEYGVSDGSNIIMVQT